MPCRDMALYIKIYDLRMVSQIKKKVLLMKYWQPKYETMNPEEMKKLQLKRLKKSLKLVYENVPFYMLKLLMISVKCLLPGKPTFGKTILSGSLLPEKKT
jgi:hypothetical protein